MSGQILARRMVRSPRMLDGRTALVTGGGGGIGTAVGAVLARDGATVTLMGRTESTLQAACELLHARGIPEARVRMVTGDALDASSVRHALAAAADEDGRLNIVVSVVGGSTLGALVDIEEDEVLRQLRRNVIPAFLAIKHAVRHMAARGGSIVCISSSAAAVPYPYLVPYGAAKAAVEGLVRGAALELAPLGVRVNALRVGPVRTGAVTRHLDARAALPLGRTGVPDDVAAAVRYLAGAETSWVTGQCFAVDGGTELVGAPAYLADLARVARRV